jgi:hypothetical protein
MEHYNSVLEITVSFLGLHTWEPDIYSGFSWALHLQYSVDHGLLSRMALVHISKSSQRVHLRYFSLTLSPPCVAGRAEEGTMGLVFF